MTTTRLKRFADTFADESRPTENFGQGGALRLDSAGADEKFTYLFPAGGPVPGVYVLEATLTLFTRGDTWAGSQTVTVTAITEAWKEGSLTWRTRPDTDATDSTSTVVGAVATHSAVEFDVTDIVRTAFLGTGEPWYGFRLGGANGVFCSSESEDPDVRPLLVIEFAELPAAAYDLVPGDDAIVSIGKPVLRWSFFDPDDGQQLAYQVQIATSDTANADGSFATPVYDSGLTLSDDPELDLAASTYVGLAAAASAYWHVRVQNAAGQLGPYSDAVFITRTTKGSLVINSPTDEIEGTTPIISTTLTGHDQRALRYVIEKMPGELVVGVDAEGWGDFGWGSGGWGSGEENPVLVITDNSDATVVAYEKARFKAPTDDGDDYDFELPKGNIKRRAQSYRLTVQSWDDVEDRVATPGDPVYTEATQLFQWVDPASPPTAPAALAATGNGAGVSLTWTRASVPDRWHLMVDDSVVETVDGLDWQVSGTNYGVTYYGAAAGDSHEYEVIAAVETGGEYVTSTGNPTVTFATDVMGIWFVSSEFGTAEEPATTLRLLGEASSPSTIGEDSEDITAVGRQSVITVVDNVRGYEGDVSGIIEGVEDLETLQGWKGQPSRVLRLIMGDMNVPVNLGRLSVGRMPQERGVYDVTIGVKQSDEYDIEPRG